MMNTMEHKGYYGSAEVDLEGHALVGKLLYIRDTIAYSATDLAGLRQAFEEAVEDYLATCQELGDEPDVPCKGVFNVRVGPERHLKAALEARKRNISLNELVSQGLDLVLQPRPAPMTVNNFDQITVVVSAPAGNEFKAQRISSISAGGTRAIAVH